MPNPEVLYVSYDGLTDPLGQSQVLPYLIGLEDRGYSITILSFEKTHNYKSAHSTIEGLLVGKQIIWVPRVYHKSPPIVSTLFDLWIMWRTAKELVHNGRFQLIHCRSYLAGLIGMRLKRKYKVKFLFDIRGFWADERVDGGLWPQSVLLYRIIYKYFKNQEIKMMVAADHIISLTQSGKEEIISGRLFGPSKAISIDSNRITVIPCAVDLDLFDPAKISEEAKLRLRTELGLDGVENVVTYLGSIGTWYLLDDMLTYFKLFQHQNTSSKFLFITRDDPKYILSRAEELGVSPERILIRSAMRAEVPLYLSVATLGIFFIKPVYSKKASSATKMGELLAMGLPIITNKGVGDCDKILDKFECGQLIDLNVIQLAEHRQAKLGNIKDLLKSYSLLEGVASYWKIYNGII